MRTAALIVAAGRGLRAVKAAGMAKQYVSLAGRPLLAHTLDVFGSHPAISLVQVVIRPGDEALYAEATKSILFALNPAVEGGATRQVSVARGLAALAAQSPDLVLIHDAARPFVDHAVIDRVIGALERHAGAIAALPITETLKREGPSGTISETVDRAGLWRAQTPQGFLFSTILDIHRAAAAEERRDFTDDAAIAEWAGIDVALVHGSARNIKVTTAEDLALAAASFETARAMEPRTGTGFDVHRFAEGTSVWLCGVEIPHFVKLEGHSDADVGLHALTDAILGALGDGDIGQHFPPTDPKWKGARSKVFLEDATRRVAERGGRITNADITLLCETPRVGPHRDAMRAAIAAILGIDVGRIGVKATTTEGLGFTGRREGIAAMASATVLLPIAS